MGEERDARTAVVVGAGIGGLAAAVALHREGWRVRIVERAARPRELGFALLLAPNAIASLQRLGLADAVVAAGFVVEGGAMYGAGGRLLRRFDTTTVRHRLAHPPVVILRPQLHGLLMAAVGEEHLVLGTEVVGAEVDGGRPALRLADGERVTGDLIVGADGAGSVIRRSLHPDEAAPRESGLYAVRGVAHGLPGAPVAEGAQYFGPGIEAGIAPAGRDHVYWYISLLERQLAGSLDPLTIARRCAAVFDRRLQAIVDATAAEDVRLDALRDRDPIADWGRGPLTLLGDAAHPMLPHAGQGAAQALEDAVALGRSLARGPDVEVALRRYEAVRARRTRAIVLLARRNARVASVGSPAGTWLRDTALRWVPASVWLRAYVQFGHPPPLD